MREPILWRDPPLRLSAATAQHQNLYGVYKEYLEEALDIAEQWWDGMINDAVNLKGVDALEAEKGLFDEVFAGPAACDQVVWTVRSFWLRCVALNREVAHDDRVPPQVLLIGWLIDEGRNDWATILAGMPYWPIGLDEKGDWV